MQLQEIISKGLKTLRANISNRQFSLGGKDFKIERNAINTDWIVIYQNNPIGIIYNDLKGTWITGDKII